MFVLQCLYNQEQKFSVSTLEVVDGLLLSCMGQKVQCLCACLWRLTCTMCQVKPSVLITEFLLMSLLAVTVFMISSH